MSSKGKETDLPFNIHRAAMYALCLGETDIRIPQASAEIIARKAAEVMLCHLKTTVSIFENDYRNAVVSRAAQRVAR